MARSVILDVDTGSDDAVAVMLATLAPQIDLVACTTVWGNLDVQSTTANTLAVLDHVGATETPVYRGLGQPYAPVQWTPEENPTANLATVHAIGLPASAREPGAASAVEYLVETLRATTEPLTLVPVAPLSNIAAAITADRSIVHAVEEIVIMGGGHAVTNMTASSESNIWHDPVAADVVFSAGFQRLVLVPLDATHQAVISEEQGQRMRALGTPAATMTATLVEQRLHADRASSGLGRRATLHDALCIAYLIDPTVVTLTACHTEIETIGTRTYGRTVIDTRPDSDAPVNSHVALSADGDRFFDILYRTFSTVPQ